MGNQEVALKNDDGTDKVDADGNVVKQSGKYITGLSNTTWDADNIVADRAATEGQLQDIIGTEIGKINDSIKIRNRPLSVTVERRLKSGQRIP